MPDSGESSLAELARQFPAGFEIVDGAVRAMDAARARDLYRRSCEGRRRRSDPHFRRLWLGDWRRVMIENLAHGARAYQLIVITPPGADVLPWDESLCRHPPGEPHSGTRGCRVVGAVSRDWNETAPERFSALHRAAATRVRRALGSFRISLYAWEPQARGPLHMNVAVPSETPRERAAAKLYRQTLAELAPRYGFGYVDRKQRSMTGLHAGRYVAKYLSEGTGKLGIGDLAARDDAPRTIAYVDRKLTMATGSTMRACRERRSVWNLASRLAPLSAEGCSLEEAREVRAILARRRWYEKMARSGARRHLHGADWNSELARLHAEADADARWIALRLAKLGLQPEFLD